MIRFISVCVVVSVCVCMCVCACVSLSVCIISVGTVAYRRPTYSNALILSQINSASL